MVKKTITILEHEDKTSKGLDGKAKRDYSRFKCDLIDEGIKWMSAFDSDLIKDLKDHENRPINVEIAQTGDFFNLRKFYGAVATGETEAIKEENISFLDNVKVEKPLLKMPGKYTPTSMYVSYVKDLVAAGIAEEKAIMIIKQAYKAFS